MKKILSIVLSVILLSCSISCVFAEETFSELVSIGIIDDTSGFDNPISKAEFSYSVAKLMGSGKIAAKETRFSDVTAENPYSGYIDFLAMHGVVDNTENIAFGPDNYVSADMANKMLVIALGYGKLAGFSGGYPIGFNSVASSIGIHEKVSFKDAQKITKGEAVQLLSNSLYTELAASANNINDLWDSSLKSGFTSLSKRFDISIYTGEIEKADIGNKTVRFRVYSNKFETNPVLALNGDVLTLTSSGTVDIAGFEHVPAEVWVEDDKIIFIKKAKNVDVKYSVIDSVNGNRSESYTTSKVAINKISFLDDETIYDTAEDFKVYYNGKEHSSSVLLNNKLCKVIFVNDEILSVETWDYKEKGIISSITEEEIAYKSTNGNVLKLKDVNLYKNVRVIINDSSSSLKDLKNYSVFGYWENGDDLVIIANERIVVDEFKRYATGTITIGNGLYYTNNVYFSSDGIKYTINSEYDKLFGLCVKAFFGLNGKVKYVETYDESTLSTEFYGYITGVEKDTFDDDEAILEVWILNEAPEKNYFTVNAKTVYSGGASLTGIENADKKAVSSSDDITKNVYKLTKNTKGVITEIKTAERFTGFSGIYSTPSLFTDSVAYISAEGKSLYFDKVPVTVVYMLDDELKISQVSFENKLRSKRIGTNAKMAFFAASDKSSPELVLLWGNDVSQVGSKIVQYGIYLDKMETVDNDGNKKFEISILTGKGKSEYVVSDKVADRLNGRSFIAFYSDVLFSEDEIVLYSTPLDFNGDPDTWETSATASGLKRGTVVRIDDKMLVTDKRDSLGNVTGIEVFMAHPSQNFFLEYDSESQNNPFKVISSSEIYEGDTVYYNNISDGLRGVIVVR